MSQNWRLADPVTSPKDIRLERLVREIFGQRFAHINENVTKALSLYGFLANHRHESADELARTVLGENGKPLFTKSDIQEIQSILERQKNTSYFRRVTGKQTGGSPLDSDPSRSKFFDKMIRKITYPITSRIPPSWDGILWYVFILYNLEQTEFIGPFIATAMDTITLSLPVMAELASEGFEKLVSLAPIPYAGFAGEILGYIVSLIFILFAVTLNIGRMHFGSAFKVSLEAIPVFGDMLMDAAQSVETGAERYLQNRNKLLKPIDRISPTLYDNLNYYVPDTNIHLKSPPPLSYNVVKKDVAGFVLEETGVSDTLAKIPSPNALAKNAVQSTLQSNTKSKNAEEKPKNAEEKPKNAEEKPKNAEAKPKDAEEKSKNAEAKPKDAEAKPKDEKSKKKGGATRRNKEYRRRMTRRL